MSIEKVELISVVGLFGSKIIDVLGYFTDNPDGSSTLHITNIALEDERIIQVVDPCCRMLDQTA